mgnify:CR=1 FL=1
MTRCGAGGKKRELRNIVRSSRFFLQPCCRSGWSRPTSGAQCSSGDCLLLCSGTCSLLCYRPATGPPRSIPGAGRSLPGRHSFEALSLSAGPVLLRPFSRGGALSSRPALLRGPFAIGRPGSSPHLFTGRGALFPAGTPSRPFRYRPARFFSAPFHGAGCSLPGRHSFEALSLSAGPVLLRTFSRGGVLPLRPAGAPSGPRRYRAAANSLSRAISSGQRSSSGVSRMSGMPSKRASEAM